MRISDCADTALLVELEAVADASAGEPALALARALEAPPRPPGLGACVVGLHSLLVEYDSLVTDASAVRAAIRRAAEAPPGMTAATPPRRWVLEVCFDAEAGPDLDGVAARAGTDRVGLLATLTGCELRVAMIGHLPGLPYLTGLPASLDLPRLRTPRTTVPAGSVGVAAAMACVYPREAPGGWHLVGRTEARLFDPRRRTASPLRVGDVVRLCDAARATDPATPRERHWLRRVPSR